MVSLQRQPSLAAELPLLVPGYDQTPAAARAMLAGLRLSGEVLNEAIVAAIGQLAKPAET